VFRRGDDRNYYAILQVDPRAEPEVIEAAYRRLSRKYHPDVSEDPEAGRRMRDLNEAYAVLSDPGRRRAYDRRRPVGPGPGAANRPLTLQDMLRPIFPYLFLALLAVLSIRLIPLLLRPPVLIALAIAVCAFLLLRRVRRR
jgi:hypothetical protein